MHPERLALPAAYIYTPLLVLLYPFVWATNLLANGVLRLFGVSREQASNSLSSEELRTVVAEAGAMIPHRHQQMLVSILDLENATVEDIMVPRNEIVGIDVDDGWDKMLEQLRQSQHTRLPVYEGEIDRIMGVLHMKQVVHELARGRLDRDALIEAGQRPRGVLRAVGHDAQYPVAEFSAGQAAHGIRRRRVRRHPGTGDSRGHTRGDRRRVHDRSRRP